MQQKSLFEQIFSDAHVVDIDVSAWDKRIALYVLADHVESTTPGRLPLFVVEFTAVARWEITFNHLSLDPPLELAPDEHVQWRLDDFDMESNEDGWRITLWGWSITPRMTVVCQQVNIREIPIDIPDRLFPGWGKPFSGFIRPGLEELSNRK